MYSTQSGSSAISASMSFVAATPTRLVQIRELAGVLADLVLAVGVDPDELELGTAQDRAKGLAGDVAGRPLNDAQAAGDLAHVSAG